MHPFSLSPRGQDGDPDVGLHFALDVINGRSLPISQFTSLSTTVHCPLQFSITAIRLTAAYCYQGPPPSSYQGPPPSWYQPAAWFQAPLHSIKARHHRHLSAIRACHKGPQYTQGVPATPRECPLRSGGARYTQRVPATLRGCPLRPEGAHYAQRVPTTPKESQSPLHPQIKIRMDFSNILNIEGSLGDVERPLPVVSSSESQHGIGRKRGGSWLPWEDRLLAKEVLARDPITNREGRKEDRWKEIARNLESLNMQRSWASCKDRISKLIEYHRQEQIKARQATGTNEEVTDFISNMDNIILLSDSVSMDQEIRKKAKAKL
ncbi:uncharacterized protein LAJ45_06171 [Morchella importuna]|uniref:uncharacterized protein n=1 Tax=Morchella importuna TaxID=1174673 RepID=UPI001E8EAEFB|nr:uncharacterized protein LAJ45_06171 [Morchella importuna]KAH8149543.1 hypothetical protein LAJ45_06171 [Morchella importuna]